MGHVVVLDIRTLCAFGIGPQRRHAEHDENRTGIRRSQGGVDIRSGGALLLRHFLYSLNGCRQGAVIEGQWNVAYFWHQSEGPLNAQRS